MARPSTTTAAATPAPFAELLARAVERRKSLRDSAVAESFRAFSGLADGMDGVFIDVYGPGAVLIVYEGTAPAWFDPGVEASRVLDLLRPLDVRAVYIKPFSKDRSRSGGAQPTIATQPAPAAGETLPEAILVREWDLTLEVRLYDGLSTGLFLDQRNNRRFIGKYVAALAARSGPGATRAPTVLNTFAYTCGFSVAAALRGALTTSVDVSARYLDWGKRNFVHNGIDAAATEGGHRFAKMDTFEFFRYARRKAHRYDVVILDPPSFASGSKRKNVRAWSAVDDYAKLVCEAVSVLEPGGLIFASSNTHELCRAGRLEREIIKGLAAAQRNEAPNWVTLPEIPADFARDRGRFAARAFTLE